MSSPLPKLLVLAAAAFIYVTAETLPVGLLPEISGDLGVGESAVGLLLTFYAYGVAVMTMPLIRFVREWPRRRVVVITVAALGTFATPLGGIRRLSDVGDLPNALRGNAWSLLGRRRARRGVARAAR